MSSATLTAVSNAGVTADRAPGGEGAWLAERLMPEMRGTIRGALQAQRLHKREPLLAGMTGAE